jgi:hypothetical protein
MGKRATRKNRAAAQGKFSYGVDRPPLSWLWPNYPIDIDKLIDTIGNLIAFGILKSIALRDNKILH